ncbi:hypothetical protein [Rhizobium leguminosarum]|uniref:hypothetical protein n=1 Tax=Rhizobium leguminosarum TaxID=384 RepID=UPI0013EEA1C6|nr:hypothetical protein [Rhizobium leguminosarum]
MPSITATRPAPIQHMSVSVPNDIAHSAPLIVILLIFNNQPQRPSNVPALFGWAVNNRRYGMLVGSTPMKET